MSPCSRASGADSGATDAARLAYKQLEEARSTARPSRKRIIDALLERHGTTYAAELGIDLGRGTPSVLFRWLCASILLSARISAGIAVHAARALADQGWTTAEKMAAATWEQRTRTLNEAGDARYDESTSRMLGDTATMLLKRYGGDLRKLRQAAERDPAPGPGLRGAAESASLALAWPGPARPARDRGAPRRAGPACRQMDRAPSQAS